MKRRNGETEKRRHEDTSATHNGGLEAHFVGRHTSLEIRFTEDKPDQRSKQIKRNKRS